MNTFAICFAGNGNPPPPKTPKRSDVPVEQDPIDEAPQPTTPAPAQ